MAKFKRIGSSNTWYSEDQINIAKENYRKMKSKRTGLKESGYYPEGAEFDPKAPYNEKEKKEIEANVYVSLSLSKGFTIRTKNYELDEDGDPVFTNLEEDALQQILLPCDATATIFNISMPLNLHELEKKYIKTSEGWNIDELTVMED